MAAPEQLNNQGGSTVHRHANARPTPRVERRSSNRRSRATPLEATLVITTSFSLPRYCHADGSRAASRRHVDG
jgi:hypothetical protein